MSYALVASLSNYAYTNSFNTIQPTRKIEERQLEIKTTSVEFQSSNPKGITRGFLVSPFAAGKYPGVLVIQEIWGLVENIKDIA
jgi:hypothetical protein